MHIVPASTAAAHTFYYMASAYHIEKKIQMKYGKIKINFPFIGLLLIDY